MQLLNCIQNINNNYILYKYAYNAGMGQGIPKLLNVFKFKNANRLRKELSVYIRLKIYKILNAISGYK